MTEENLLLSEEDEVKVFKLVTGEEIVTRVTKASEQFFVIEVPLEIRYNSIEQRLFLSRWKMGSDYSKVMTLSGYSIVSVSGPDSNILENYIQYKDKLIESLTSDDTDEEEPDPEPEHEQIILNTDEDTPTIH